MTNTPPIYLLTAPRGAGKTVFCKNLAAQARAAGWDVAGMLSPAVFENGERTGILAQNLRTGKTRPLAQLSASSHQLSTFDIHLGHWLFSSSALAWGNEILASSLPCDLFIVDELGPLELVCNQGWVNALQALTQPHYRVGIVVIRPELLETACLLFPIHKILLLDSQSRDGYEFFSTLLHENRV